MFKKLGLIVLLSLALALVAVTGLAASPHKTPQSLHLDLFAAPDTDLLPGDVVTITYQLFNSEMGAEAVIFYAPVPSGTTFLSVEGACPMTYTLGLKTAANCTGSMGTGSMGTGTLPLTGVKSIVWDGELSALRLITMTVQVLPGDEDIPARASLVDKTTGATIMQVEKILSRYRETHYVFLPVIMNNYTPPVEFPLEIKGNSFLIESQDPDYANIVAGTSREMYLNPASGFWRASQIYAFDWWSVTRPYLEFDTSRIEPGQVSSVTLKLWVSSKTEGDVTASIYTGNWSSLSDPRSVWDAFDQPAIATVFGDLPQEIVSYPLDEPHLVTVSLPTSAINPGGKTRLVIKGNFDGASNPSLFMSVVGAKRFFIENGVPVSAPMPPVLLLE